MADTQDSRGSAASPGFAAVLVRVFWLLLGPSLLVIAGFLIASQSSGKLSVLDGAFFGILALILVARFVDVARLSGETADGKPATMRDVGLHAVRLGFAAVAGWGLAHASALI